MSAAARVPSLQGRLVRLLDDGAITRVGGTSPIALDVRLVAASSTGLAAAAEAHAATVAALDAVDGGLLRECGHGGQS